VSARTLKRSCHTLECFRCAGVLPDADDGPAMVLERSVYGGVPLRIPTEFRAAIASVDSRLASVVRASMPEAAIQKHRHPVSGKGDVGLYFQLASSDKQVLTKPQAFSMKTRAKQLFGPRIGPTAALHHRRDCGA
jgi:hypothetical protein